MKTGTRDRGPGTGKPVCGKCGNRCLVGEVEVNSQDRASVLKCPICGWRSYSQARQPYQDIPIKSVKGVVAGFGTNHMSQFMTGRCRVIECGALIRYDNESGLCRTCQSRQHNWKNTNQTTHPPFIASPDIAGMLTVNPLRGQRIAKGVNHA